MNVLSDILCDSSSLMVPQSYKGNLSQGKLISSQADIVNSKQGPLQLPDSLPNISSNERAFSVINASSPSIDLFNSSEHIHIPQNMEAAFDDRNQASLFTSNLFPEIVPPWLGHDFMKVSDNLPSPGMLSNVSDIYTASRENDQLDMQLEMISPQTDITTSKQNSLLWGFPPELGSQDVSNTLSRECVDNGQKLLPEISMSRFSTPDPLLIPTFNNLTPHPILINKNVMPYQKYKHDPHQLDSTRTLINSVLPCENDLLQLPLPSSLTDQCLNSSSSPVIISNKQSQPQSMDVCDKLPQINLNQLDSLLGNDSAIQLLRQDFPNVHIDAEVGCSQPPTQTCTNVCQTSESIVSCDNRNYQASVLTPISHSQDISVQVSENLPQENFDPEVEKCVSCNRTQLNSSFEIIRCFKCKFCSFISIHKCTMADHVNLCHSNSSDIPNITSASVSRMDNSIMSQRSENINSSIKSLGRQNEAHLLNTENRVSSALLLVNSNPISNSDTNIMEPLPSHSEKEITNILKKTIDNNYVCIKCNLLFTDIQICKSHLLSEHNIKFDNLNIDTSSNFFGTYQIIVTNSDATKTIENLITNSTSHLPDGKSNVQNDRLKKNTNAKKKIAPKKPDELQKKNSTVKKPQTVESTLTNSDKHISSHKKAWQKKMNREICSYICEFKGCNVRFRALDNLEYHRKCHVSGGATFACPECQKKFDNWGPIAGHLWRDHSNNMELHACDQCSFRTYSLSRLENVHKRIHREECLFLCDTCGKRFKNGKQLRNHRAIHSKKVKLKPATTYECNICNGKFKSQRILRYHQHSVHNKVKPFVCTYCEYTASKSSTMRMHMRQHTGEKPFGCDKCDYRTADHNSLRRHKMKHSGEKPYKCPYCSYSSIQASTYKAHLKKHPGQNEGLMFACKLCSFRTIKEESYKTHLAEHESLAISPSMNNRNRTDTNDEMFPLAEAMDISLSHADHSLLTHASKNNINIQSFLNNLNVNMNSICGNAT